MRDLIIGLGLMTTVLIATVGLGVIAVARDVPTGTLLIGLATCWYLALRVCAE